MIIYNVTINIDDDVHDEWVQWMNDEHIPAVMKCGLFTNARMCKLLVDEEAGTTYAVQYTAPSMSEYEQYRDNFATVLQTETMKKFKDKYVAFRTLLEVTGEFKQTD